MTKNFTKLMLGMLVSSASMSINAAEWKTIFKEDFGGNDASDSIICSVAPNDKDSSAIDGFFTPLKFSGVLNPFPGMYMLLKSTELAEDRFGGKLTDCGDGGACWVGLGDHTNPDDPNKGYFMVFDAPDDGTVVDEKNALVLFKKAVPASSLNGKVRFSACMASASKWGGNTIRLSIQDENGKTLAYFSDDLASGTITPGQWKELELEYSLVESTNNHVYFVIEATAVNASGYDLAIDDVTVEINVPEETAQQTQSEWNTVYSFDFGGNEASAPVMLSESYNDKDADAEDGFYTPLKFSELLNPSPGIYMVIKSTELAESIFGDKLTDCDAGEACWEGFGDHTNSDDSNKGYFMVFDAVDGGPAVDEKGNLVLYKKTMPASSVNGKVRFSAWMASATQWGGNTVRLSIQDENGKTLAYFSDDLASGTITPGQWKELELEYSLVDTTINKVNFVIEATSVNSSGYDLAIDDISIQVKKAENDNVVNYLTDAANVVKTEYYNLAGQKVKENFKGMVIVRKYLDNGSVVVSKIIKE